MFLLLGCGSQAHYVEANASIGAQIYVRTYTIKGKPWTVEHVLRNMEFRVVRPRPSAHVAQLSQLCLDLSSHAAIAIVVDAAINWFFYTVAIWFSAWIFLAEAIKQRFQINFTLLSNRGIPRYLQLMGQNPQIRAEIYRLYSTKWIFFYSYSKTH